jgi:hypothetical protein
MGSTSISDSYLHSTKRDGASTRSQLTSLPLAGSLQPLDTDGTRSTPPESRFGLAVGSMSVTSGLALGAPDGLPPPLTVASFMTVVRTVAGGPSGYEVTTPVEEATSLVGLTV